MSSIQADNFIAFVHQGYPLYCPNCHQNVDTSSIDYKNHLQKHPSTCMYCKTVWAKKVRQWVDEKELSLMRSRLPSVSFNEMSTLGFEVLERQPPTSLEEKRAQVVWLHSKCSTGINDLEIKRHLKMYFPDWTNDKIEDGYNEIKTIITREHEGEKAQQKIVGYLKRNQGK